MVLMRGVPLLCSLLTIGRMVEQCQAASTTSSKEDTTTKMAVERIQAGHPVFDTRDELTVEVHGYLVNSTRATLEEGDVTEGVFLVNNDDRNNEFCTSGKAVCYEGPLDIFGDRHVFPVDVSFAALQILLKDNRVILIDVRNTTELEETGKIPGSHNLPLTDIPAAFLLPEAEFQAKYGFPLPAKEAKKHCPHLQIW